MIRLLGIVSIVAGISVRTDIPRNRASAFAMDESERDDIEDDVCLPERHVQLLQLPLHSESFLSLPVKERVALTRAAIKQSRLSRGVKSLLLAIFEIGETRTDLSVNELCSSTSIRKRSFYRYEETLRKNSITLQRYSPAHGKYVAISRRPGKGTYYALLLLNDDARYCKYCQLVGSSGACDDVHSLLNALTSITADFPSLTDNDRRSCRALSNLFTSEVIAGAIQHLWRSWKHFDASLPLTPAKLHCYMIARLDVYETRGDAEAESLSEASRMTEERLRSIAQTNVDMHSVAYPQRPQKCQIVTTNGTIFPTATE